MARNLNPEQREHVEEEAWRLRVVDGLDWRAIGDRLGVDPSTALRAYRRIATEIAERFAAEVVEHRAIQQARLEQLYLEAVDAWRSSRGEAESVSVVAGRAELDRAGRVVELPDQVTTTTRKQAGDANLLARALDALKAQR